MLTLLTRASNRTTLRALHPPTRGGCHAKHHGSCPLVVGHRLRARRLRLSSASSPARHDLHSCRRHAIAWRVLVRAHERLSLSDSNDRHRYCPAARHWADAAIDSSTSSTEPDRRHADARDRDPARRAAPARWPARAICPRLAAARACVAGRRRGIGRRRLGARMAKCAARVVGRRARDAADATVAAQHLRPAPGAGEQRRHRAARDGPGPGLQPAPARTLSGARAAGRRECGRRADQGRRVRRCGVSACTSAGAAAGKRARAGRQWPEPGRARCAGAVVDRRPDAGAARLQRCRQEHADQHAHCERRAAHRRRAQRRRARPPHDDRALAASHARRRLHHRYAGPAHLAAGHRRGGAGGCVRRYRVAGAALPLPRLPPRR